MTVGCKLDGGSRISVSARKFMVESDVCDLGVRVQHQRLGFGFVRQFDNPATQCEKRDVAGRERKGQGYVP